MIRTAIPGRSSREPGLPAATSPVTREAVGASSEALATSTARTAYPSIAAFAKAGSDPAAVTSWARTRPGQSSSGTSTRGSVATPESTSAR